VSVQVTQDAKFGPVVDLLVKLVEHERGLVILGVRASDGSQRLPPGSCGQLLEQVLPESVRTVQDGNGLRGGGRCRVIPLKPAGQSLHSQPLRVPIPPVASDEVPQPPRDRRKGRVTGTSGGTQDSDGPVRVISAIGPGPPTRHTGNPRTSTDGGASGYSDRPARLWATTCRVSCLLASARLGLRHRNGGLLNVIEDVDDDIDV
jgi:hypothetical protein